MEKAAREANGAGAQNDWKWMDCRTHAAGNKVNVRATMLSLHRGKKQATGYYVYYHVDEGRAIEQLFIFLE